VDYRGEKRSNETHESKSDPERNWARKGAGKEAKLSYSGICWWRTRNGLIVDSRVWEATGTPSAMRRWKCCRKSRKRARDGAGDKGFDTVRNSCASAGTFGDAARGAKSCTKRWQRD